MSHWARSTLGRARDRWWSLAAPLLLVVLASGGVLSAASSRSPSAASARPLRARGAADLSRLSAQGQAVVSSALGASDPRFAPRRQGGGLGLAGGRVTAALGTHGIAVQGDGARLSLGLVALGRGGRLRRLPAVLPRVRTHRVVYARAGGVQEWYAAGPLGIEQGFTLARRPAGAAGAVTLALSRAGPSARLVGSGVEFLTRSRRVALRYGGLVARDARGRRLRAWLSLSGRRLLVRVADGGARYPLMIDPLIQQGAKLTASGESGPGQFGFSVALSGDGETALVGGFNDAGSSGAAWVFTRTDGTWTQQGPKLTANAPVGRSSFGYAVALSWDGNTALIGAPGDNGNVGAAYVFARSGGTWTQQGSKLTAAGESGQGNFGISAALSGDGQVALIGAAGDHGAVGAAWVFARSGSTWTQQGSKLTASDESSGSAVPGVFGWSVALSGDGSTALIGADGDNAGVGAAWVFARSGSSWTQQGPKLTSSQPVGSFGYSVALSLDGATALVGSPDVGGASGSGAAWVFARSGSRWSQQGSKLAPTDETGGGNFGTSVALSGDGDTALIGAGADNGGVGAAWEFARSAGKWTQQGAKLTASDEIGHGGFGSSVTLSSDAATAFVGAPGDNGDAGATWAAGPARSPSYVYWDNDAQGTIGRDTIDGDPANVNQSLATGIKQIDQVGVTVDRQHLYWSNGLSIERSDLDGKNVDPNFIHLPAAADHLVVSDQYIYWSNAAGIGRANLDGTDVTPDLINLSGHTVSGLAVDSQHIYWAERFNGTIGRANLDGSGVTSSFVTVDPGVAGVAVDSQHIYWAQDTSGTPAGGSIGRASIDGTGADPTFITGAATPRGIAVDGEHIYWANYVTCNFQTNPFSDCTGGTIGRANLNGSAVDQAYITADQDAGSGCDTDPESPCGPSAVALSPPTQPICMRTSLTPALVPPPGGAVFSRLLDPARSDANVVVLPAGVSWTGDGSCVGVSQGSAQVMTHPTSIEVSPHAALLLRDQFAGLVSAWGARDVGASDPAPVLFPGRSDWQTTEADVVAPQQLLTTYGGCPSCFTPKTNNFATLTPPTADPDVGYQGDVSGATLTGLTLSGDFDGWNFTGANLIDATMSKIEVSGADFTSADLRGAQISSLKSTAPPIFARARIGAVDGTPPCTTFTDTNLVAAQFSDLTADMAGCANIPLLPQSSAPLGLIRELTVLRKADVDYSNANFVVTGADHAVLADADLHGIDLAGASFLGFPADFEGTNFDGAALTDTSFQLADLSEDPANHPATFKDATAPGASFEDANLTGADFTLPTVTSPPTDLENADFIGAVISNASFQSADIAGAKFNDTWADGTSFNSALASGATFNGAHIYGNGDAFDGATHLSGADFSGAVLAGTDATNGFALTGANLTGAKFDNAQCIDCNFTGATLDSANFTGAYLPGAQLASAHSLQGTSFDNAWLYCGDRSNDSCAKHPKSTNTWDWPLQLGSLESFGPVAFPTATLTNSQWTNVTCPDGTNSPTVHTKDCEGHMLPSPTGTPPPPAIPAPCSAVALDACPTTTSTLFDSGKAPAGSPIAVVAATAPAWATEPTDSGYYAGFTDSTVRLIGPGGHAQLIAGTHDSPCAAPTESCGGGRGAARNAGRPGRRPRRVALHRRSDAAPGAADRSLGHDHHRGRHRPTLQRSERRLR